MTRDNINKDLEKAISHLPPEMRARLNTFKNELMEITYQDGISEEEFNLRTKHLQEAFNLDIKKDGAKSSK